MSLIKAKTLQPFTLFVQPPVRRRYPAGVIIDVPEHIFEMFEHTHLERIEDADNLKSQLGITVEAESGPKSELVKEKINANSKAKRGGRSRNSRNSAQ